MLFVTVEKQILDKPLNQHLDNDGTHEIQQVKLRDILLPFN